MQVSFTPVSVSASDEEPGVFIVVAKVPSAPAARAFGCRLDEEMVLDLPDAQPPNIYSVSIPEEEAASQEPKKRGGK